jgi:xanthine dehydrogenase YagS FAD-binding subunit
MQPFKYARAKSVADAAARLAEQPNAKLIAGGTNLLDLMKLQIETPDALIDVNGLPLDKIEPTPEGGLRIGALARNADLAADMSVRRDYPVLARAILAGASPQLRNRATTAGNLLQRTRCPYFYDTNQPCNKRAPGSGCSAIAGYSRQLAVVGGSSDCIATYPGDMAVALRALDATVHVVDSDNRTREIAIADFHRLPGRTPQIENDLRKGEIITSVTLPKPVGGKQIYRKIRDRASYAFALVSVAAIVGADRVRVAIGGVAPKPWRDEAAEQAISRDGVKRFAEALFADAKPTEDNRFKVALAQRAVASIVSTNRG